MLEEEKKESTVTINCGRGNQGSGLHSGWGQVLYVDVEQWNPMIL